MKLLLLLYLEFFKVGLFSIGGGLATIPFLQELSIKYGWFDQKLFTDMIAISESTPGPIGVNMATYVGYHTAGIPGGIISTLGLISPSIIIILLIACLLTQFKENRYV
ncbi:MAG: chromate transporter, partial [Spirochaetales bacterium]|nr:chromate transporter [Spirochaetales bacterium]